MMDARHHWFPKVSLLLCLFTAHASLSQSAGDLFRQDGDSETCGGFAVPVKPASAQITERHDIGLESAKTRTGLGAPLLPVSLIAGQNLVCCESFRDADQPRQPQSALLRVRFGRAPPATFLL